MIQDNLTITLTPFDAKACSTKQYTETNVSNLIKSIKGMGNYIFFCFSENKNKVVTDKIISIIENKPIQAFVFVPYDCNEMINRAVHNIKAIKEVQAQLEISSFADENKKKISESCVTALNSYVTALNLYDEKYKQSGIIDSTRPKYKM